MKSMFEDIISMRKRVKSVVKLRKDWTPVAFSQKEPHPAKTWNKNTYGLTQVVNLIKLKQKVKLIWPKILTFDSKLPRSNRDGFSWLTKQDLNWSKDFMFDVDECLHNILHLAKASEPGYTHHEVAERFCELE